MRRLVIAVMSAALLLTASALAPEETCAVGNCGFKPLKPLPPLGCKDLVAVCQCDAQGSNCHWVWNCI